MTFHSYGQPGRPRLLLIHGLGVTHEIFLPLIGRLEGEFDITAVGIDGFLLGEKSRYTSIDDQAGQIIAHVREHFDGHLDVAYGLSLGGKILLPLPRWSVDPLRYYQNFNVWTCYHCTGFWKWVFHSHYINAMLDECKKAWPSGKGKAVRDGYKDVYTNKLESIHGADIQFWHGTKEGFVARPQARHLLALCPEARVEVFPGMNHGQLLMDRPDEVADRIRKCILTEN